MSDFNFSTTYLTSNNIENIKEIIMLVMNKVYLENLKAKCMKVSLKEETILFN